MTAPIQTARFVCKAEHVRELTDTISIDIERKFLFYDLTGSCISFIKIVGQLYHILPS